MQSEYSFIYLYLSFKAYLFPFLLVSFEDQILEKRFSPQTMQSSKTGARVTLYRV